MVSMVDQDIMEGNIYVLPDGTEVAGCGIPIQQPYQKRMLRTIEKCKKPVLPSHGRKSGMTAYRKAMQVWKETQI